MAEMNPAKKADIAPGVYAALKRHGMRGTLSCARHNTLVCYYSTLCNVRLNGRLRGRLQNEVTK